MAEESLRHLQAQRPAWLPRAAAQHARREPSPMPSTSSTDGGVSSTALSKLQDAVHRLEQQMHILHKAVVQMQQHVHHAANVGNAAQRGVQNTHKAMQPLRTDVDSLQRQLAELRASHETRYEATQIQLKAAARMMAAVYPEFLSGDGVADPFTRAVATEMQHLAEQCDDSQDEEDEEDA